MALDPVDPAAAHLAALWERRDTARYPTLSAAADALGYARTALADYLAGRCPLTLEAAVRLAVLLGAAPAVLSPEHAAWFEALGYPPAGMFCERYRAARAATRAAIQHALDLDEAVREAQDPDVEAGRRLRNLWEQRDPRRAPTLTTVARRAGYSVAALSSYIRGLRRMGFASGLRIAAVLGVHPARIRPDWLDRWTRPYSPAVDPIGRRYLAAGAATQNAVTQLLALEQAAGEQRVDRRERDT